MNNIFHIEHVLVIERERERERERGAVVWWLAHPPVGVRSPDQPGVNTWLHMALNIRDCVHLCLSDKTVNAIAPLDLFGVYAGLVYARGSI